MADAACILAAGVGRSDVQYVQILYADALEAMIRNGASRSFGDAVMETARSFNEGAVWAREPHSPQNATETTLELWERTVFKRAYESAKSEHNRGQAKWREGPRKSVHS